MCKPVILALQRLRQENNELEASLGCIVRHCLKKIRNKTKQQQNMFAIDKQK
jgi:hypothetical protein